MYWEKIQGAFTFLELYNNMVQKFDNAIFVEIGVWKGKSTIYMAEKIMETRKNIQLWAVDIFEGNTGMANGQDKIPGNILQVYYKNIEPVKEYIHTIVGNSTEVHSQFQDENIDFIFIDGDHRYEAVKKDLKGWFPKLKIGGVIAGHDYNEPSCGVRQAVDEFFLFGAKPYIGGCWIYYK